MKKAFVVLLILSIVFMGAQCGKKKTEAPKPFSGGSEGLAISFAENAPLESFTRGEEIPVSVVLKNKGEYNVPAGKAKVKLFGVDLKSFNLENAGNYKATTEPLQGKSALYPEGSEVVMDLGNLNYKPSIPGDFQEYTLKARVCYEYKTTTSVPICIKPKIAQDSTVCTVEPETEVEEGFVSSSPVQLTSISTEQVGSNKVRFSLTFENKGNGKVYSADVSCEDLEDTVKRSLHEGELKIKVESPTSIVCTPQNLREFTARLENGKATVVCVVTSNEAVKDYLNLDVYFKYVSETNKKLTIYSSEI